MRAKSNHSGVRWLERALFAVGVACLGYYGYQTIEARQVQRAQIAALESALATRPLPPFESHRAASAPHAPNAPSAPSAPGVPGPLALLEIPRLNLSSAILSGDSEAVLDVAIGHLPDTPTPWEPGNSAVAAHRDGLFRPLRHIRVGDEVRVRSPHGEFTYRVRETRIVAPDDLSVLAPTDTQTLTLITCYPFNYVGSAPKRFIVHAERIEGARRTK